MNELASIYAELGEAFGNARLSGIMQVPEGCSDADLESLILNGDLEEFPLPPVPLRAFAQERKH
jgi:hypothetical protein